MSSTLDLNAFGSSELTTVWGMPSRFAHVTVVPTDTVSAAGSKLKLSISNDHFSLRSEHVLVAAHHASGKRNEGPKWDVFQRLDTVASAFIPRLDLFHPLQERKRKLE